MFHLPDDVLRIIYSFNNTLTAYDNVVKDFNVLMTEKCKGHLKSTSTYTVDSEEIRGSLMSYSIERRVKRKNGLTFNKLSKILTQNTFVYWNVDHTVRAHRINHIINLISVKQTKIIENRTVDNTTEIAIMYDLINLLYTNYNIKYYDYI